MDYKKLLPHIVAVAVFFIAVFASFTPAFQGKTIRQGDIVNYQGASKEMLDYQQATGERTNWTGSMFAGMPTYQISTVNAGNNLRYVHKAFRGYLGGVPAYFFLAMLCFYIFLVLQRVNPWASIALAVAGAFATNNIVLFSAGHVSKLEVVFYLPIVAAGILMAFRGRYILGSLLFSLGMGLAILSNHPQMLYYFGMTLPFYGAYELYRAVKDGKLPHFAKATGGLVVGLLLAVGAGASTLITTTEYLPQSIRGGNVLSQPVTAAAADAPEQGLDWDYAMAWSNGWKDVVATFAPFAAGGGSGQEVESASDFGRAMRQVGFNLPGSFPAPLYHGGLTFTEGPVYLGAVVWALFLFGLFTAKKKYRIWLGLGTLLIFLITMGKNAAWINRPFFDLLPMFSNFRTPNSAHTISVFMMLALGALGLHEWVGKLVADRPKALSQLKYAGITSLAIGLFVVFVYPLTVSFGSEFDAQNIARFTGGQGDTGQLVAALIDTRQEFHSDYAWRSLLFVGLAYGVLFLLQRGTYGIAVGGILLGAIGLVDFMGVNTNYLSADDWQPRRVVSNTIQTTPADELILQDPDPHYRVLNLSRRPDQDALTSYFHKSLGGYSAVKLRRYQDLLEGYILQNDIDVLNMLNTKYLLIPDGDNQLQAQQNPDAYGPAWLVSRIEAVDSEDAAFRALGTVENLRETAIIDADYHDAVAGLDPSGEGSVTLESYAPNELIYDFSSPSEQLVVFSEIWYGPDLGWEVTIDGQPADLIRANYALRALRVPAGDHRIVMEFRPSSFATGRTISFASSLIIILGLLAFGTYSFLQRREIDNTATPTAQIKE